MEASRHTPHSRDQNGVSKEHGHPDIIWVDEASHLPIDFFTKLAPRMPNFYVDFANAEVKMTFTAIMHNHDGA